MWSEEYDKTFHPRKVIFSDIYRSGPIGWNLEHHIVESRYQSGLVYQKALTKVELFAHVSHKALDEDWWPNHRWELNIQTGF